MSARATWDDLGGLVRAHLEGARNKKAIQPRGAGLKKARRVAGFPLMLAPTLELDLSHPEERGAITEAAYRLVTEELTLHRQVGRLLALAEPRRLRGTAS